MGQTNILLRKRFYISLVIWFVNVLVWSIITSVYMEESPLPGIFWLLFLTAYVIQAVPLWLILNTYFREKKQSNLALVSLMPFLILVGLWLFFLVDAALKSSLGGLR